MQKEQIVEHNRTYWNEHADLWFGKTALPTYGVKFPTEEELHLFGDVAGKKLLEIGCGSGHSLKYHADRNAGELWGLDVSRQQLNQAERYLTEHGYSAHLICAPMEAQSDIPRNYFDYVYSIYAIGWATDLQRTFDNIASYLKKDGVFIFSWHHPLNYCVAWSCAQRREVIEDGKLVFHKSYFDEEYFHMPVDDSEVILCNRKISTYVNALAKAGFVLERLVEQNDRASMEAPEDTNTLKAKMVPISMCFRARKL